EEIEQNRHLPTDVVELLRSTAVFRMALAKARGGPELTSAQQTEVIETLSYGDTSAGWCAMIGMDTPLYSAFLSEDAVREMFPRKDMITAGLFFPSGRAAGSAWPTGCPRAASSPAAVSWRPVPTARRCGG
ncbi:hypothetical protein K7G98_29695, partial [Saccharothrix sp. MB29]|nr:hypothetical protein [Saccharothrix sp. MB29]